MTTPRLLPLVILALVSGLTGFLLYRGLTGGETASAAADARTARESTAPTFSLPDVEGTVHSSAEWDGKVRIVNFWATWCPPCRREIPLLVDMQREFADQGVQVIGVAIDDPAAVTDFAARIPFNYPVLVGEQEAVDVANAYLPDFVGLPFTAFIDASGSIVEVHMGELHRRQIEDVLDKIL